jgi:hypothetical protein
VRKSSDDTEVVPPVLETHRHPKALEGRACRDRLLSRFLHSFYEPAAVRAPRSDIMRIAGKGGLLLDERKGVSYRDGAQEPAGVIRMVYDCNRRPDRQILMARFTEKDVLQG